jgi:hypothetical protein
MRLRNPDITKAIETTRRVQSELGNAQNAAGVAANRAVGFLTWCESWARPQLGNYFPETEELFAELAASHRRIALRPSMEERTLNGLLSEEIKTWDARLEDLVAELQALQPFVSRPGRLLVLDTSALMEGPPFTSFDWAAILPPLPAEVAALGPHQRLIVPILVIEELDNLMHDRDGGRRQRARETFRSLWELHGPQPAAPASLPDQLATTIEVMLDGDWHRRRPSNDAEIIDQAVAVRQLTGRDVRLVTADGPMLYRAAAASLIPVRMPRRDETP